jgi:hypothetical protein
MTKLRASSAGSVFLLSLVASFVWGAKVPEGADSAQALADRLVTAAKNTDGYELAACTVPDDRNAIAGTLVFTTTMTVGSMGNDEARRAEGKKYRAELDAIFKKYGVDKNIKDPEAILRKDGEANYSALVKGADTIAVSGDLMKFMKDLPGVAGDGPFAAYTRISNIKVEGDRATATGADGPLEFVKVGGRWYVHVSPPTSELESDESPESD